ncbi:MAG: hypothetical protein ACRD2Z_08690 [Thermoanaerobaculia bacterium]
MTYKPNFDKDLRFGEAREDAFVHVLLRSRIEHKSDRQCQSTGNLAIEFEQVCRDGQTRGSGIQLTEADRMVFEYADDCWLVVPTGVVKALARRAYAQGKHKWMGDGDNHHCVLIPIERFVHRPPVEAA